MVQQYLDHSKTILSSEKSPKSTFKFNERRGVGRIYIFAHQNRYDLSEGLPLLTTKRVGFKTITHELLWFLRGQTNIKYLVDNKVHIWTDDAFKHNLGSMVKEEVFPEAFEAYSPEWAAIKNEYAQRIKEDEEFAERWGELGPVYGSQWVHWPKFLPIGVREIDGEQREVYVKDPNGIDQLERLIKGMKKNLTSSRHIVSAWNPDEVPNMALPPCHTLFQLDSDKETLSLQLYQRSCDMFLGVPFNIASYSLLTNILAKELDLQPGEFIHTFGDVHFYTGAGERAKWYGNNIDNFRLVMQETIRSGNYTGALDWLNGVLPPEEEGKEGMDHVTGILEQLTRTPKKLPVVKIANKPYNELTIDDFSLEHYNPEPPISRTLIVG